MFHSEENVIYKSVLLLGCFFYQIIILILTRAFATWSVILWEKTDSFISVMDRGRRLSSYQFFPQNSGILLLLFISTKQDLLNSCRKGHLTPLIHKYYWWDTNKASNSSTPYKKGIAEDSLRAQPFLLHTFPSPLSLGTDLLLRSSKEPVVSVILQNPTYFLLETAVTVVQWPNRDEVYKKRKQAS